MFSRSEYLWDICLSFRLDRCFLVRHSFNESFSLYHLYVLFRYFSRDRALFTFWHPFYLAKRPLIVDYNCSNWWFRRLNLLKCSSLNLTWYIIVNRRQDCRKDVGLRICCEIFSPLKIAQFFHWSTQVFDIILADRRTLVFGQEAGNSNWNVCFSILTSNWVIHWSCIGRIRLRLGWRDCDCERWLLQFLWLSLATSSQKFLWS